MDPYEEIRRLREENARLQAQLNMIQGRTSQYETRYETQCETNLSRRKYSMIECYEIFCDIIENNGFSIYGKGESYTIECNEGKIYYFMKGKDNKNNYLMIQKNDDLVYRVRKIQITSDGNIIIKYGSDKTLYLQLVEGKLIVETYDVISIKRINRIIIIKNELLLRRGGFQI